MEAVPNVWGQGLLFAWSGWDGETSWADDFVGSGLPDHPGLAFSGHVPVRLFFQDRILKPRIVTGDCLDLELSPRHGVSIHVRMALVDRQTLIGSITCDSPEGWTEIHLEPESPSTRGTAGEGEIRLAHLNHELYFRWNGRGEVRSDSAAWTIRLSPGTFSLSANPQFRPDLSILEKAVRERLEFLHSLPSPPASFLQSDSERRMRTFRKCATVMKVNLHSPQDQVHYRWSTPDRVPHKNMWLWDSAFHAIGLRWLSGEWAEENIQAVLEQIQDNGYIPHMIRPNGKGSHVTQPPILAWASWEVYRITRNRGFLEYVYDRNTRFIDYCFNERDRNLDGLCEWTEGGESGMDNSPRFDGGCDFNAVDLNCMLAQEMRIQGRIAGELGKAGESAAWESRYRRFSEKVNEAFWNKEAGIYLDQHWDKSHSPLKTVSAFLPLYAGVASREQAERLVAHLTDTKEFWTRFPIPSVAIDEPVYTRDMWRGPTWVNYNQLIVKGLRDYHYQEVAQSLVERTIDEIVRFYHQDGVIFEYYDAESELSPRLLWRKGKQGGPGWINNCIRDYHWTAALFVNMAMEG